MQKQRTEPWEQQSTSSQQRINYNRTATLGRTAAICHWLGRELKCMSLVPNTES